MTIGHLSIFLLLVVGVLCTIGVFAPLYNDTLGERCGMSLIALWCLATGRGEGVRPIH